MRIKFFAELGQLFANMALASILLACALFGSKKQGKKKKKRREVKEKK